ncbi:hypothetical protein TSUD_244870 [Trifolium subterraneum]|uniref:Uncharacterized protein n=1 Tax=Trifolium subterraneum TaxID=3900 RepID=A0A2Z6NHN3_TRISU|nr:hypothetical protein TSUD_244870 [Trifolium subterraneum]
MNLESATDVKGCILKINTLSYAQEACYNDFSSLSDAQDIEDGDNNSDPISGTLLPLRFQNLDGSSLNSDENLEEKEKLVFICSCAIECVKDDSSVLIIPIDRLGTILQLLEEMTTLLEASAMEVSFLVLICSA